MNVNQQALAQLRDVLQLGRERIFHGTSVFAVSSEDPERLDGLEKSILEQLDAYGFKARVAVARQADALLALLPFADNRMAQVYRNMTIGGASRMWPIFGDEFGHPGGVFIGHTKNSKTPAFLNLHQGPPALTNPRMGVFATSGAGKTTFLRALIAGSAVYGIKQVVIDAGGEYALLSDFVDTEIVRVEPESRGILNPFDIEPEEGGALNLAEKRLDIQGLVLAMAS